MWTVPILSNDFEPFDGIGIPNNVVQPHWSVLFYPVGESVEAVMEEGASAPWKFVRYFGGFVHGWERAIFSRL